MLRSGSSLCDFARLRILLVAILPGVADCPRLWRAAKLQHSGEVPYLFSLSSLLSRLSQCWQLTSKQGLDNASAFQWGLLDNASAFQWHLPGLCSILNWYDEKNWNHRANWPSGFLKFNNHVNDQWSVLVSWTFFHIGMGGSASLIEWELTDLAS